MAACYGKHIGAFLYGIIIINEFKKNHVRVVQKNSIQNWILSTTEYVKPTILQPIPASYTEYWIMIISVNFHISYYTHICPGPQ